MPKIKVEPRDPMTPNETRQMIEKSDNPRDKALVACLYLVGPRITEALNLKRDDITIAEKEVSIKLRPLKRTKKGSPLIHRHTLTFPVTAPFMDFLVRWVETVPEGEYIFPGYNPHMTRQNAWIIIKKLNPNTFPHFFRHTRLSNLADLGGGPFSLRDWAGRVTIPVEYISRNPAKLRQLAKRIT